MNNNDISAWIIVPQNHTVEYCSDLTSPFTYTKTPKSLGTSLYQYVLTTSDHVVYIFCKDSKALKLYTNECDPKFKLSNKFTWSDEKNE